MQVLSTLVVVLLFTLIGGQLSTRCHLPAVIGELLAGIVIGPAILNWVSPSNLLASFADLGVVLLMFLAGLESDLAILKKLWRQSVLVAAMGMVVPIITAYLTGIMFHFAKSESLFLGLIFAATSVSISVAVLQEMGQLNSQVGMTILGAAVVDDLLAIILLSVTSNLMSAANGGTTAALQLVKPLLLQVGYLGLLALTGIWFMPRLITLSRRLTLPVPTTLVSLLLVLAAAWLAEAVGLSSVLGAFLTGLALGRSSAKVELQKNFTVLGYSSFIPIFFASIGLKMSLTGIFQDGTLFLTLFLGGVMSKLLGAGLGAKLAGFANQQALTIGAGMVSRGEMALVVAQLGLQQHLLAPEAYSVVVGSIIMTTLLAPFLLRWLLNSKK
ncbi:cation:proton antiporter [Lactobacillus xylocopicola]|uniref:Sodium:proton antiporter n=1 Tax=Lactobacillus xylocopicola TaxID=2976676 RepID=A0ABN6SJP2_9LACO|nr:cation:proton antiporter [Lactobacillus xylocopicola]BDR60596.1 sodium:proton antiporter [Lactobacillus xylocopicola]